jgi:hypothetical protein
MAKIHGLTGKPKSRRHRERLRASANEFWKRAHAALAREQRAEEARHGDE